MLHDESSYHPQETAPTTVAQANGKTTGSVSTSRTAWTSNTSEERSTCPRDQSPVSADTTRTGRRTAATAWTCWSAGTGIALTSLEISSQGCTPLSRPTRGRSASPSASLRTSNTPDCRTGRAAGAGTRGLLMATSEKENATFLVLATWLRFVEQPLRWTSSTLNVKAAYLLHLQPVHWQKCLQTPLCLQPLQWLPPLRQQRPHLLHQQLNHPQFYQASPSTPTWGP